MKKEQTNIINFRSCLLVCLSHALTLSCCAYAQNAGSADSHPATKTAAKVLNGSVKVDSTASAAPKKVDTTATATAAPAAASQHQTLLGKAMNLYQTKQYEMAADVFEAVLPTAASARVTYYAGLSNQYAGRLARAKSLFSYVVTSFPDTTEAKYSQIALTNGSLEIQKAQSSQPAQPVQTAAEKQLTDQLMEKAKAQLPKDMQAALSTPEGMAAFRQATVSATKEHASQPTRVASVYRPPAIIDPLDNSFVQISEHTQYSDFMKSEILGALHLMPTGVKQSLFAGGTRIIVDVDSRDLGRDPGFDAAGMYMARENVVRMAERNGPRILVRYAREVILHEMGHAFDQGKSDSSAFLEVYQAECDALNADDLKTLDYYATHDLTQRPNHECFAELFKINCEAGTEQGEHGGYSRKDHVLAKKFPKTLALVKSMSQN